MLALAACVSSIISSHTWRCTQHQPALHSQVTKYTLSCLSVGLPTHSITPWSFTCSHPHTHKAPRSGTSLCRVKVRINRILLTFQKDACTAHRWIQVSSGKKSQTLSWSDDPVHVLSWWYRAWKHSCLHVYRAPMIWAIRLCQLQRCEHVTWWRRAHLSEESR